MYGVPVGVVSRNLTGMHRISLPLTTVRTRIAIYPLRRSQIALGGPVFFIRTDHIGRPVFATNDLGVKVWEASYLPLGGVQASTGGVDLSESGLHQNRKPLNHPTPHHTKS